MTDPSPASDRPRNPFEGLPRPEPFHRSPEFVRFIWLVALLVIVGLVGFYFASTARRKESAERTVAERTTSLPALLGPEEREARERRLSTILEGSLADAQNGTDFAETSGYRRLLQILMSYPREEVEARAVRKLDWQAAMADPDAWRGEFVWARGLVANLYAVRLRDPVFGIRDVYQGILTDADGSNGVFFDSIEQPPPLELREDVVDVYGIFYRTVRYPTAARETDKELPPYRTRTPEGDVQESPYLLIKSLRPVVHPKSDPAGFLQEHSAAVLVGMALAFGAAWLLVYLFHRRSRRPPASRLPPAGFHDMFEKRLRQEKRTGGPRSQA